MDTFNIVNLSCFKHLAIFSALLLVLTMKEPSSYAASFKLDRSHSSFFAYRSAGISVNEEMKDTIIGTRNDEYGNMMYTGTVSTSEYGELTETLYQSVSVSNDSNSASVETEALIEIYGQFTSPQSVTVSDSSGIGPSYSIMTADTVFQILPDENESIGDPVRVNITSLASSYDYGPFDTKTTLDSSSDNFHILHNADAVYYASEQFFSPNGYIQDDTFAASIGDTITTKATLTAQIGGTQTINDNYSNNHSSAAIALNSELNVMELSDNFATPVPEPATMLLFGLGILGLAGLRWTFCK